MPATLHTEAMAWLRYGKHMPLVCTEAGYWSADVLGIDDTKCVEVEIKKSIADLRADFRRKTRKHETYANLKADGRAIWSPNYFWIFVPASIGRQALTVLDELDAKHAGLAVLEAETTRPGHAGRWVTILRRAPRLHGNKPHPKLVRAIQLRMGSELTTLRLNLELLKHAKPEQVDAIVQSALEISKSLVETQDWEKDSECGQEASETAGPSPDAPR
jgi:hypothetical protein